MDALLLARWQRVADDARRLRSQLRGMFDVCGYRQTDEPLPELCACCREEAPFLEACARCEAVVDSLRSDLDELVGNTLRHLDSLVLMDTIAAYGDGDSNRVSELRRRTFQLVVTFLKLEGAIDEIRGGCSLRHLVFSEKLVDRLGTATHELDVMLRMEPPGASARPYLVDR